MLYAGAIDNAGGEILDWIIKSTKDGGNIVSVGMASSYQLNTTVFPLIMRGVNILGVTSTNYPNNKRKEIWHKLSTKYKKYVPLVIKISPDMTHHEVLVLCNLIKLYSIDGIIATNTTVDKKVLSNDDFLDNKGGVSGNPLLEKANNVLEQVTKNLGDKTAIIGVGGIMSKESAQEKINLGADLLQMYSGLVYCGTSIINEITRSLK